MKSMVSCALVVVAVLFASCVPSRQGTTVSGDEVMPDAEATVSAAPSASAPASASASASVSAAPAPSASAPAKK